MYPNLKYYVDMEANIKMLSSLFLYYETHIQWKVLYEERMLSPLAPSVQKWIR
jgi:hypothetical protein